MKKLWIVIPVLISLAFVFLPDHASAGMFDPIIQENCYCDAEHNNGIESAPDWGCVLQSMQNAVNLLISLSVIVATIAIAWAGGLWMTSPLNAQNRERGRTMLLNAVIGLVVVLVAWTFVDFLMKSLYNEGASSGTVTLGPWNSIIEKTSDEQRCIKVKEALPPPATPDTVTPGDPTPTEPVNPPGDDQPSADWRSYFGFQSGISAQASYASDSLSEVLSCMAGRLQQEGRSFSNVISSISSRGIASGNVTMETCSKHEGPGFSSSNCPHMAGSCHYGGSSCWDDGKSYAADFGFATLGSSNAPYIIAAANACGAVRAAVENGNHVHVAAPNRCGQNNATCR